MAHALKKMFSRIAETVPTDTHDRLRKHACVFQERA